MHDDGRLLGGGSRWWWLTSVGGTSPESTNDLFLATSLQENCIYLVTLRKWVDPCECRRERCRIAGFPVQTHKHRFPRTCDTDMHTLTVLKELPWVSHLCGIRLFLSSEIPQNALSITARPGCDKCCAILLFTPECSGERTSGKDTLEGCIDVLFSPLISFSPSLLLPSDNGKNRLDSHYQLCSRGSTYLGYTSYDLMLCVLVGAVLFWHRNIAV